MLLYADDNLGVKKTYQELFDALNNRTVLKKYIYTSSVYDVIESLVYAMVNGYNVVLLDGDFSEKELENLGLDNDLLEEKYLNNNPRQIQSQEELIDAIKENENICTIGIHTSGTTGVPKRFDHSLHSLLRNIKVNAKHQRDVWGFAYNVTHFAGIQVLLQGLCNRNPIINIFGDNAKSAESVIDKYLCNCISATPTYYRNFILVSDDIHEQVKNITFGGERFSDNLLKKIHFKFPNARIRNVYASTEVGSLLSGDNESFSIPDNLKNMIKISDDNHLLIHKSLLLHKKIDEEWYDTNDVVKLKSDGTFTILNRESDFLNIGGYKVNPLEVEELICKVAGVTDAVVYGRDNSVMGKLLVAEVVTEDKNSWADTKKLIIDTLKANLQVFKVPRIIKNVDSISKSRTGKKVR